MKVKVERQLNNNNYICNLSIIEPEIGNYIEGVNDFGEKPINFGGKIIDTDDTTTLATLANNDVKITDIIKTPVRQSFAMSQYAGNTEKVAMQWIANSVKKIEEYVKEVSAKVDTFSGSEVFDV